MKKIIYLAIIKTLLVSTLNLLFLFSFETKSSLEFFGFELGFGSWAALALNIPGAFIFFVASFYWLFNYEILSSNLDSKESLNNLAILVSGIIVSILPLFFTAKAILILPFAFSTVFYLESPLRKKVLGEKPRRLGSILFLIVQMSSMSIFALINQAMSQGIETFFDGTFFLIGVYILLGTLLFSGFLRFKEYYEIRMRNLLNL